MSAALVLMPDYSVALIDYLRSNEAMTAVAGAARIGSEIPSGTQRPTHNHLVIRKSGRAIVDPPKGTLSPRIDLVGFGTTPYESLRIIRTAHAILIPEHGDTRFVHRGVIFDSVDEVNDPVDGEDERGWPFVLQTYAMVILRRLMPGPEVGE